MSQDHAHLGSTTSLCPTCLERVPGRYEARDGSVHLARECPDHGTTSRRVWDSLDHWEWADDYGPEVNPDPNPADDLAVDAGHACLAVVEVTQDCNLSCSYCFAGSGPGGTEPPFDHVVDLLETAGQDGPRPIQFSGGEPTVRDDLPALVEEAVEMGFDHIQVNTNGLRMAREDGYAARLADAGVTAVYLQFDGLRSTTYEAIREVDILAEKHAAIEACRSADLPVVLVPTVVPGTNDDEMGEIVRFALENRDVIESVNFQPVAHFGRYAENQGRFSLDEAARRLAAQFDPLEPRDLVPIPCCSSYCQSATALLPREDGDPIPLTRFLNDTMFDSLADTVDEADWMELLANTPVGGDCACSAAGCCDVEVPGGAAGLLETVVPVSFTGFMDADAADVNRLDNCCVSVPTPSGELVPFCAYNMTTEDGRYALRERHGWGGRPAVDEPLPDPRSTGGSRTGDSTRIDTDGGCRSNDDCCGGGP